MSGKAKRTLYGISVAVLGVLALAATVALGFFGAIRNEDSLVGCTVALLVFGALNLFLPLSVLIHESGHLLFGALSGLRFISFSVSRLVITRKKIRFAGKQSFSGETQMLPKSTKGVRARIIAFALGGAILNLIFGMVFLVLFFVAPSHPVLFFFELCSPLNLFEGISALLPAELEAGRTDGKILAELFGKTAFSQVFLSVLTAQGILFSQSYSSIPRELLFELPVVREDEPAFLALTQLRWQFLISCGDETAAEEQMKRLENIADFCGAEDKHAEILCDIAYFYKVYFNNDARAEEIFATAERAKGSAAYARTEFALHDIKEEEALSLISKETAKGVRDFETSLVARTKDKKNSALRQNV